MKVVPKNDSLSWIRIDFKDSLSEIYLIYSFEYNNLSQILSSHSSSRVDFIDYQLIKGKMYQNVYKFVCTGVQSFYDTLYYNREGFLKFVSADNGYVLERLP